MATLRVRARHDPARLLRRGLVVLVLVVSAAVAASLLRPAARPSGAGETAAEPATGTTVGQMELLRFRDDNRRIEVKARAMQRQQADVMQLEGVEASFPYVSQGRPGTMTIRADQCQYQPGLERAAFKGNVKLRTDDGFELASDSLKYWGDKERIFTPDPLTFRRGALSGSAIGMEYREGSGLQLRGAVKMRVEDPAGPPTDIDAVWASGSRAERRVTFHEQVTVTQGARELRASELRLDLSEDLHEVEKATASGGVDAVAGPGASLPGAEAPASGTRRLRSQRLEVGFRPAGVLRQALATGAASLEMVPGEAPAPEADAGPGGPPERRRLAGPRLEFAFDEAGRLASVAVPRASGSGGAGRQRASLESEPLVAGTRPARRVDSDTLLARLEPVTGAVADAVFEGGVVWSEPGRKAFAGHSRFDAATGELVLTREPRVVDEAEGSELRGREIRVATGTGALRAGGGVRHTISRKGRAGAGPFQGDQPTVLVCREFEYDPASRTAHYRESAAATSGTDEVRAPLITLEEPAPGEQRMTATGGVSSVLQPRPAKGKEEKPAQVETRSRELVYEQAKNRIVYSGEVEIRQGDILTRSPEAVVLLAQDGETVDRMLAGAPVEVHQGRKRATGERGAYTPANETLVLTGEPVVLYDVDRRLEGRILTFEVGSDRIRLDGREEVRSEAVFRRKELVKP